MHNSCSFQGHCKGYRATDAGILDTVATFSAYLEAGTAEHKVNHALLLASLEEGQVLLGLVGAAALQGHIIVVVHWRVLALVVHSLLAAHAAGLGIHQRLIVPAALII